MKNIFFWLALILLVPLPLRAQEKPAYGILLGNFTEAGPAVELAKEASCRLRLPLAKKNIDPFPTYPQYLGKVIRVIQPRPNSFQVLSHLGFQAMDSKAHLRETRKIFPQAQRISLGLERNELDPSFLEPLRRSLIVLDRAQTFPEAKRQAETFSQKINMPYSTRGLEFLFPKGLVWPPEDPKTYRAGIYFPRQENGECDPNQSECITIERSEAYQTYPQGEYLVLGGVYPPEDIRIKTQLKKIKKILPRAYRRTVRVNRSCAW